jgi:hypothetical protein
MVVYFGLTPPSGSTQMGEFGAAPLAAKDEAGKSSPGLVVTIERSTIQPYLARATVKVQNVGSDYYGSFVLRCAALAGTERVSPTEVFIDGAQYGPWRPGFWMERELMFSGNRDKNISGFACEAHGTPADAETAPRLSQGH